MKALTEHLEWIKLALWDLPEGPIKTAALDSWIACNAIAEALPEIPVYCDGITIDKPSRTPPERVIELPNG